MVQPIMTLGHIHEYSGGCWQRLDGLAPRNNIPQYHKTAGFPSAQATDPSTKVIKPSKFQLLLPLWLDNEILNHAPNRIQQ
jgi:hypothetical protein